MFYLLILIFQFFAHIVGEFYKLLDSELLRALGHDVGGVEILAWGYTREHLLEAYTEHLATLVEDCLYQTLKQFSSQPRSVTLLRVMRITALFTFGGGLNTFSSTVKRYSTSYHAWMSTLRIP